MDQETAYLAMIERATGFSIGLSQTGQDLLLTTSAGPLLYSTSPPAPLPNPAILLVDRIWFLKAIGDRETVTGNEPTAFFTSDGVVSGSTGCNEFNASYQTQETSILIGPVSITGNTCDEPLDSQEKAFLASFQVAQQYEVDSSRLRIAAGTAPTMFFTSRPPKPPTPTSEPTAGPTPTQGPSEPTPTETPAEPEPTDTPGEPTPTESVTAEPTPTDTPQATSPPTAVINAPTEGQAGQAITFNGSGSSAEAGIQSYAWDFGDGNLGEGSQIEHIFNTAGTYTVTLTVTDYDGQSSSTSIIITIF
jgi:heat shock protein HslJ